MIDLNEMEEVCEAATPGPWLMHGGTNRIDAPVFDDPEADWRLATAIRDEDRKFIARARTWLPALVEELIQAREELAAVDESLGDFYAPVLDPETEEPCGSFWKDHGVWVMRDALELAQAEFKRLLHVQAERGTLSALMPLYYAVDDYLHDAAGDDYPFIHHNYDGRDRLAALQGVFLGMSDAPPVIDEEADNG